MHGTTVHKTASGGVTVRGEKTAAAPVGGNGGLVDMYRDRCMACGRPVNPAHGICDCGVQNGKPGDVGGGETK
ncbi:hypothetical protein TWF481_003100 [Arthrobotrys musiformis]|uniref:Uncharacterized protein n=1 Tax=Arthrobotrys musiformis TaxID=47236 RepID=A0AAV9VQB2_9PEZI